MAASLADRMIGAMKADVKTFQEIEADQTAIGQAVAVIVIAALASWIGHIWSMGVIGGIVMLIATLCRYALWALLVVLIGTKVMPEPTTKADFNEGFRVIGFTAAPGVFNIFSGLFLVGWLVSSAIWVWMIVIGVVAVREVLDYSSTARAIIVCLITAVICWIVSAIVVLPVLIGSALMR